MKKNFQKTITLCALGLSIGSFAQTPPPPTEKKEANFEQHKREMLEHIDKRVANLNETRQCLSMATNHEAAKACHEKFKEDREALHSQMKEHKKDRLDEKMKKLDAKKSELEKK